MRHIPTAVAATLAIATTAAVLAGCGSVGAVHQGGFNLISLDQEWAMRDQMRQQVEAQKQVVNDPAAEAYLNQLGQRIVARTALAGRPWSFGIVRDDSVNAFNLPGGLVYVNSGLLAHATKLDQLTGVLAHEIGHGVARHGTQLMSRQYGLDVLASVALGQNPGAAKQILAQVVGTGILNSYSREAESEADSLGVKYAWQAGYDPHGLPDFFRKLESMKQSDASLVARFFASHPLDAQRIASTSAEIARLPRKSGLVVDTPEYDRFQARWR